jgi:short-subunit dehydrogenase
MKLTSKVAIITGASEGIGAALARLFVQEGARVTLAARQEGKLQALANELGEENILVVPTDVTDPAQVKRMVEKTVERFGGLDILVNNAGMGYYTRVAEMDAAKHRQMWELNFFAAVDCTQQAMPHLKQRRGTVVNISSVAGKLAVPVIGAYAATKFALNAISTVLRMEMARTGVRVMTVCPGVVKTRFSENASFDAMKPEGRLSTLTQGISPEKVARETVKGIVLGKREVVVPGYYRFLFAFRNMFPALVDGVMARMRFQK